MNAHNNEKDPFEDVFRDRFADFESEPDTQLWQKIAPQLPVNFTRKFPYWQTSAVIIILLLAGFWTYREKYSDNVITKSDDSQTKNINPSLSESSRITTASIKNPSDDRQIKSISSSNYRLTDVNPKNKDLSVIDLGKSTTKKVASNVNITKLSNNSVQEGKNVFLLREKEEMTAVQENKTKISTLFSIPNTTIERVNTSLEKESSFVPKEKNNFSNNNSRTLNLISLNNSNKKKESIANNISNTQSVSSVFFTKEQVLGLNKNYLTLIDSKSCNLPSNHFKTPKLMSVAAPKRDDYFKERKPLEMYISMMPLLNYYTITPNGNDANYVHSIAVNNDDDRLGFYTQAGVVFTLTNKLKLRTGLTFTKTNHSINYQIRTDSLVVQPSDNKGVDVSFVELNRTYSQSANYLGTKIEVQYIFLKGEALSHYLNVGLEGAYRLNNEKQLNGFANFAYGVTRQIGDHAYLFLEPTFSYSLNQYSDNNSLLLVKPNKIGFNIGVTFKIK